MLKEHEARAKTADPTRKHGASEATIYNWKTKFGGMDVSEAERLRALEEENAKLMKLLAEQMRDAAALRELLSRKSRPLPVGSGLSQGRIADEDRSASGSPQFRWYSCRAYAGSQRG